MKTHISVILIVALVLLANVVIAQKQYLEKNKTYSTAKIFLKSKSEILKVSNLILLNDTVLQYRESNAGSLKQLKIIPGNVKYISAKSGTYAGTFAAAGGGIGLLSALYGILSVENEPTLETTDVNWAPFVLGFTGGGVLIGALIGSTQSRWRTLYLKDNLTTYSFKINPCFSENYCCLTVSVKF